MTRIVLVDPDETRRASLRRELCARGHEIVDAGDAGELPAIDSCDVVVSNADLPSGNGIALHRRWSAAPLILFTDDNSVRRAVEAMRLGAADYLVVPFDADELHASIARCVGRSSRPTEAAPSVPPDTPMIGGCPAMLDLFERIRQLAPLRNPVLVRGEPGSGKELVARALHASGPYRARPMISLNCATIPASMLEMELFGARGERNGLVDAAAGGTLFLDEISALSLDAQRRLLERLRDTDRTVGAAPQVEAASFRLIAATHHELRQLIDAGQFIDELFVLLGATTLNVPPLRERGDDVATLAQSLLKRICRRLSKPELSLSAASIDAIRRYEWPGNIRELENALERAVILCNCAVIEPALLAIQAAAPRPAPHAPARDEDETSLEGYFVKFVLDHQDALTETELASKLGISRKSLWERRQRLNIPRTRTRTRALRRDTRS